MTAAPRQTAEPNAASSPEARAARRGGIVLIAGLPVIAAFGVVLLALWGAAPVLVPAGVTLIVIAALGIALGIMAVRRTGPVAGLRNAIAVVAIVGIIATVVVGLTADDASASIASAFGLIVPIAATWAITQIGASAILKAERAATR